MKNIVIRNIEEKDIPYAVDIKINSWKTAYKGIIDDKFLNSMDRDKIIEKRKNDYKDINFIVAELDGEIVGFCRYTDSNKYLQKSDDTDCELLALYVKPELKRNGIGTKLLQFVVNEFKRKNKTKMILWCLKDNEPSKKFYTKMGGEIVKEELKQIGEKKYEEVGFVFNFMNNEEIFYNRIKNWDFSDIKMEEENFTNWDMYKILNEKAKNGDYILDIGTGGGEKVLEYFPNVAKIIGTDLSEEMIKTAHCNLEKSKKSNIEFKVMDNFKLNFPSNYFDIVVARHTCIDSKQIYTILKSGGLLLLRGVDKLDCWELKKLYGKGQAYNDVKPISLIDYENILNSGFKNVELVPIHIKEYYKTREDLIALLQKTPILYEFSEESVNTNLDKKIDFTLLDEYIKSHNTSKGILLIRRYYGITAYK